MKTFSLILVFSIVIIDGKNQFGQAYHQQNLDMSNIFRANYQGEKNQQKQKGHWKVFMESTYSTRLHFSSTKLDNS